jgi:hypothetical protein
MTPPAVTIASQEKGILYALFEAAAETWRTLAAGRRHLGAESGPLSA